MDSALLIPLDILKFSAYIDNGRFAQGVTVKSEDNSFYGMIYGKILDGMVLWFKDCGACW
jgi:hypothetical protein